MKIKVILSLILVGVLAFAAGLGTVAYFTSQATSEGNVFEAGTLIIGAPNEGSNTGVFNFNNWYPGYSKEETINIKNLGTLPFKYRLKAEIDGQSGSGNLSDVLYVTITAGGNEIFTGTLTTLVAEGYKVVNTNLAEGDEEELKINVKMLESAGNIYQGASATVKFTFDATQTNRDNWDS